MYSHAVLMCRGSRSAIEAFGVAMQKVKAAAGTARVYPLWARFENNHIPKQDVEAMLANFEAIGVKVPAGKVSFRAYKLE